MTDIVDELAPLQAKFVVNGLCENKKKYKKPKTATDFTLSS
jgi:hypothetical protein